MAGLLLGLMSPERPVTHIQVEYPTPNSRENYAVKIFGLEITSSNGDIQWQHIRRFAYVALITWVIGVRLMQMDPFDDLAANRVTLSTLFDGLGLYAIWLLVWHLVWPARPKISLS